MAAWQNSSSFRKKPTSESSPTAIARGVEMLQEQHRGRNHSVAAKSHCVKSSHSQSMVQDVAGSPHTSTISRGDGLNKSDVTIPASPKARIKTGTNTHGSSGSEGKGGVPRRLILTQDRNKIHQPNPISLKESRRALLENDAMVYLDGPQVYTCTNCRTHLTSHDDIISKSFHGRNGRAYLFDQCVNITTGQPEDRILITGLHTVSDISCKRCQTLVGWTYAKAYEPSQKYKEGKYIIEKIYLHMEESGYYTVDRPAGERGDKWQVRSMSWGSEESQRAGIGCTTSITSSTTSGSSWSMMMGGSYHHGDSMNRMSSPTTLPGCGGVGGGTTSPYSFRDRSSSMARSSPQTPPTPHRQSSSSPGVVSTTTSITTTTMPESPRSPSSSDIIYEYPNML